MRPLVVAAALGLLVLPAAAQTPDSVAWRRYFPLAVGNAWEYVYENEEPASPSGPGWHRVAIEHYRIVARHVRPTDTLYAMAVHMRDSLGAQPERRDTVWVRYDDARAAVVRADGYGWGFGPPTEGLDAPLDGRRATDAMLPIWGRSASPFPFPAHFASKEVVNIAGTGGRWIADIGMANASLGYDGCSMFCGSTTWRLVRATVGGRTYTVGTTSVGAKGPVVASGLTLYPSVTRTLATLHLPVAATVEAFDVSGRRVYWADAPAGDHRINVSAWAPGLYVVRVGSETRRLMVR